MTSLICDKPFEENPPYITDFENKFNIELSDFQKYSIKAIHEGYNTLVTAGTGSGKTISAYYAIDNISNGIDVNKKIIYTSPIKALSNQKYHELTNKFKNVSFGLVTGDIKINPDADVVIMTCEILRNKLKEESLSNEVSIIIFDEIHYINDPDRGTVWEESIILAGQRNNTKTETAEIQLIMLSATIDKPKEFADWVSKVTSNDTWISGLGLKRSVPLFHYSFLIFNSKCFKNKELKGLICDKMGEENNCLKILLQEENTFNPNNFNKMKKIISLMDKEQVHIKKIYAANEIGKYIADNKLTPAIFFCLSKNEIANYVNGMTINFFNGGEEVVIKNEVRKILSSKLENYHDFLELPEYSSLMQLLSKGIAYHHSGLISIFREIVEILFSKGLVKLLFATETFAVGLNMPTKTVIFDSFSKFDGNSSFRLLRSHEYTQMSGRAGRRSIDTIGYVFHLNNVFETVPELYEYKNILSNTPLTIESKFQVSYGLVLDSKKEKTIDNCDDTDDKIFNSSIMKSEIDVEYKLIIDDINKTKENLTILCSQQPLGYEDYLSLLSTQSLIKGQKAKKNIEMQLKNYNKSIVDYHNKLINLKNQLSVLENQQINCKNYIESLINKVSNELLEYQFLENNDDKLTLTHKGKIAQQIKETNPLVLTEVLLFLEETKASVNDIINTLGLFCYLEKNGDSEEEYNCENIILSFIKNTCEKYCDNGTDNIVNLNAWNIINKWTLAQNKEDCLKVLQDVNFIGNFSKSILKLNNLALEISGIEELDVEFLHKVSQISQLTLKHVITNQSLYV